MKGIILIFILTISYNLKSQKLFKGYGIYGALTISKHEYINTDTDKKDTNHIFKHFYPQSHISKEFINWGAGFFLELGRENIRWQTELEYVNKGANEMKLINPYSGERSGSYSTNKLTYIQWNNYAKFYYPIFYDSHFYFMAGARLEYLFNVSASVYSEVVNNFPIFWFSGNLALGYEYPITKKISVFTETHWNPDLISHTNDNTNIRARTFEIRAGLVIRKKKKGLDDCNTPTYKGTGY